MKTKTPSISILQIIIIAITFLSALHMFLTLSQPGFYVDFDLTHGIIHLENKK